MVILGSCQTKYRRSVFETFTMRDGVGWGAGKFGFIIQNAGLKPSQRDEMDPLELGKKICYRGKDPFSGVWTEIINFKRLVYRLQMVFISVHIKFCRFVKG